jgi:hypothetical protein
MALLNNWKGNEQRITAGNGGVPLSSQGIGLVANDTQLVLMYAGKGDNLWTCITLGATFPKWDSNIEATIDATNVKARTDFRPAAAALPNGIVHVVYQGAGGNNLWWSWFDGADFHGNISLPFVSTDQHPSLAVFDGKLHLAWHQQVEATVVNGVQTARGKELIWHSSYDPNLPLEIDSWQPPDMLADGADYPSLVPFNKSLYLFARDYPWGANPIPQGFLYGKWSGTGKFPGFSPVVIVGTNPLTYDGPTATAFGNNVVVVYRGQGGANIWYLYMDQSEHFAGNVQIKTATSTPKTSALIGAADFGGILVLAYKGESSDNMWCTYASS